MTDTQEQMDIWAGRDRSAPGVRLKTLANLRWAAVGGQSAALLFVDLFLEFPFALIPSWAAVIGLAAFNGILLLHYPRGQQLTGKQASFQLAVDLVQLVTLLYLTGGLQNPFSVLILVPVTISATILSARSTVFLLLLAFASLSFLASYHLPLPWGGEILNLSAVYLWGVVVALAIAMAFITTYAWRVSDEARKRAQALVATQTALAKEQKLSALGSLAAAAAHELGTPLGTITLISKELLRERTDDEALREDLQLLESQANRCSDILANLSRRARAEDTHFRRTPMAALVREAAEPYEHQGPEVQFTVSSSDDSPAPVVARRPEIIHGIGNFIENAARFAASQVNLDLSWDTQHIHLVIADDGPGFDPDILDTLGEPYLPSKAGTRGGSGGMGMGVFIAATLLDRTGATIIYMNDIDKGAVVDITWPRTKIEDKGDAWETA
jgi:two-component system sensor histidine kinase RegB